MQLFDLPDNFYPTPPELADRMIQGIDMDKCFSFLEPEAGSGNLVKAISRKASAQTRYIDNYSVDCIEASPYLRQVLAFEFSETNIHGLHAEERSIENCRYVLENGSTLPANVTGQAGFISGGGMYTSYYDEVLGVTIYFSYT